MRPQVLPLMATDGLAPCTPPSGPRPLAAATRAELQRADRRGRQLLGRPAPQLPVLPVRHHPLAPVRIDLHVHRLAPPGDADVVAVVVDRYHPLGVDPP